VSLANDLIVLQYFSVQQLGSSMSEYSQNLRSSYEAVRGTYQQFTERNEALLRDILTEGEDFYAIEARTKDLDSFEAKVDLPEKEQKYKDISEVTDLSGLRIICYLDEDATRVCTRLAELYDVDPDHSVNKNEQLDPDQFGYRSRHFVVRFPAARAALMENERFAGLRAEIQVRTILQHAWAAIDWKLRYKNSAEVPVHLRRRVFRVSALLELADDEFSSLSASVTSLREEYERKVEAGDLSIAIDRDSIDIFLEKDTDLEALVTLAKEVGYAIGPNHPNARDPYGGVISTASLAGMTTIDEVRGKITEVIARKDQRLGQVVEAWKGPDRPPRLVMSRAGLARLAIVLSVEATQAIALIEKLPFGQKLQDALLQVLLNE
jgi:putative GTP pyrophosphokinase